VFGPVSHWFLLSNRSGYAFPPNKTHANLLRIVKVGVKVALVLPDRYNVQNNAGHTMTGRNVSEKHTRLIRELFATIAFTLVVLFLIRFVAQSFRVCCYSSKSIEV